MSTIPETPAVSSCARAAWSAASAPWSRVASVGLLVALFWLVPVEPVLASLSAVGPRALLAFALAASWIPLDVLALSLLANRRVPLGQLGRLHLVSEAVGQVIPAMGLAGEPYRVGCLAPTLGTQGAGTVVLRYRLAHAISGALHATLMLCLALCLVPLPAAWRAALALAAGTCAVAGLALLAFSLTSAPGLVVRGLLHELGVHGEAAVSSSDRPVLLRALACKVAARLLQMLEIGAFLWLLGAPVEPGTVVLVAALLAASASLFFVAPHGLGVHEAGITTACVLLGLPASMGLTLALLRRARVIAWVGVGLAIALADRVRAGGQATTSAVAVTG